MFYGWYIVAASVLISASISGASLYGLTAMVNPIAATFGWSYTQISLSRTIQSIERGALIPLVGIAVDRWPPRRLILIGVTIVGLGLLCLSQVNNLTLFYTSFLIIGLGSSLCLQMVPTTTVARWFRRNIGKASGVLALGIGSGGLLVPVVTKIIDTYGWQTSLIAFAIGVWVIGIPLSFLFRSRPEDYGLLPDGKAQKDSKDSGASETYAFSLGPKEALRTRAFWIISLAFMFQVAGIDVVIIHVMPYLTSLGIHRATASMIIMFVSLASLTVRLPYGWLADIFQKKYLAAISIALTSVGLFLLSLIDGSSIGLIILFIIIYGIGFGGMNSLRPPILREYFGAKSFGTIYGLSNIFFTIATMITPPLAGWVFDTRGVYDPIWSILSGVCMLGAILILTMPPPPRPSGSLPTT